MELSISIPKTLRKHTTCDDRLRIETLYYEANWSVDNICLQLNLKPNQVYYALNYRLTPQHCNSGRHFFFSILQRKRLIQWVTAFAENRRIPWAEIPPILGWTCGEKAIRAAFKKEGYVRRVACCKPPLTDKHKRDWLDWAWEHFFWIEEQWFAVCWSDETWTNPGRHIKAFVTRKIGLEEVYHVDCIEARY